MYPRVNDLDVFSKNCNADSRWGQKTNLLEVKEARRRIEEDGHRRREQNSLSPGTGESALILYHFSLSPCPLDGAM